MLSGRAELPFSPFFFPFPSDLGVLETCMYTYTEATVLSTRPTIAVSLMSSENVLVPS